MHSCDNRACINIDHLELGTAKDNMQDMGRKGRQWLQKDSLPRCGEGNPCHKLLEADIIEIKLLAASAMSQRALGARFGISQSQISRIINGLRWRKANAASKR